MSDLFKMSLARIKDGVSSSELIDAVFKAMLAIENMGVQELCAAKRAFDLVRKLNKSKEDEESTAILDSVEEALIGRARGLVSFILRGKEFQDARGHFMATFGTDAYLEKISRFSPVYKE